MNDRRAVTGVLLVAVIGCDADVPPAAGAAEERELCDYVPAGRWVLRDKDGARISAKVEPRCGQTPDAASQQDCLPSDFGPGNNFPCVRVIDHEGRYINVQYELATGTIEPCHSPPDEFETSWKKLGAAYEGPACGGAPYRETYHGGGYFDPEFTRARDLAAREGSVWYLSEKSCHEEGTELWHLDLDTEQCVKFSDEFQRCVLDTLPDWVHGLLPNPPYSLAVEYE